MAKKRVHTCFRPYFEHSMEYAQYTCAYVYIHIYMNIYIYIHIYRFQCGRGACLAQTTHRSCMPARASIHLPTCACKSFPPFAPMLTCSPPATHTRTCMLHTPSTHIHIHLHPTRPYSQIRKRREALEHARRQRRDLIVVEIPAQAQAG